MAYSRRRFLQWAAAVSAAGVPRRLGAAPRAAIDRSSCRPSARSGIGRRGWRSSVRAHTGNKRPHRVRRVSRHDDEAARPRGDARALHFSAVGSAALAALPWLRRTPRCIGRR